MDWKEVKVKYTKQLEDGRLQRVSEIFLFDAVSFTDAEERAYSKFGEEIQGAFSIEAITKRQIEDIFYYDDADDWYKCKVTYIAIDGDEGKEKKIARDFLVTANTSKQAIERIQECLADIVGNFEIPEVKKTAIQEVIPYAEAEMESRAV